MAVKWACIIICWNAFLVGGNLLDAVWFYENRYHLRAPRVVALSGLLFMYSCNTNSVRCFSIFSSSGFIPRFANACKVLGEDAKFTNNSISNSQRISQSDLILSEHEIQADLYINQNLISRPTVVKACHVHLCWKLVCYIIHQSNTVKSIKHRYLNNVLLIWKRISLSNIYCMQNYTCTCFLLTVVKQGEIKILNICITYSAIDGDARNRSFRNDVKQFVAEIFCQIIFCLDWR